MGLMKCPDCKSEVSDRLDACPKCGCPFTEEIKKVMKCEPERIFIEMARGGEKEKRRTVSRKARLLELYAACN